MTRMGKKWTKEAALRALHQFAEETRVLANSRRHGEEHVRWLMNSLGLLEDVFGRNSTYYASLAAIPWGRSGSFLVGGPGDPAGSLNPAAAIEREHERAYQEQLETARGFLLGASDRLTNAESVDDVYEGRDTGPEAGELLRIVNLAEFKLRRVIRKEPQTEGEVQDAFESLLIGADIQYSREVGGIEYSSKTYTPDFIMPKVELAIDVKLCGRAGREKELIAEINDDILAYQTKYRNLFFIVYDVSQIRDIERFAGSFEEHENVIVRVVKH
jgi:hypothetical protein